MTRSEVVEKAASDEIWIIDDLLRDASPVATRLMKLGFTVRTFADPSEASTSTWPAGGALVRGIVLDLVFRNDERGGETFLASVRSGKTMLPSSTAVVVYTHIEKPSVHRRLRKMGIADIIVKNMDPDNELKRLEASIGRTAVVGEEHFEVVACDMGAGLATLIIHIDGCELEREVEMQWLPISKRMVGSTGVIILEQVYDPATGVVTTSGHVSEAKRTRSSKRQWGHIMRQLGGAEAALDRKGRR